MSARFEKVPADTLFVSEPNPMWFGNGANPTNDKHWTNGNWLKSRFHFSFAEYHDRDRSQFGVLRVMNDDLVQPNRGFGTHPHSNMEIVTYIVQGSLTHQDSMGTSETLGRGSIQFMTAGTGVRHSEFNQDKKKPLRFIQIWITPRENYLPPNYGSTEGDFEARHNKFAHLVSDVKAKHDTPVKINQDANIFVAELDKGVSAALEVAADRQAYVLCMEGAAEVELGTYKDSLERHDAGKVFGQGTLQFSAQQDKTHVLVVEMAKRA